MTLTPNTAPARRRAAGGGVLTGLAVTAVWAVAIRFSDLLVPQQATHDQAAYLGATINATLAVAVPGSLAAALLTAWLLHLRRPWLLSLAGLPAAALAAFAGLMLAGGLPVPFGLVTVVALVAAAYAGVAALSAPAPVAAARSGPASPRHLTGPEA